jgi:hypothetical protein
MRTVLQCYSSMYHNESLAATSQWSEACSDGDPPGASSWPATQPLLLNRFLLVLDHSPAHPVAMRGLWSLRNDDFAAALHRQTALA